MSDDDKVESLPKNSKNQVEQITNNLIETEKKKKQEELKKAVEEAIAAKKVLINAISKVKDIEEEIKDISNNKLDFNNLAKALGL